MSPSEKTDKPIPLSRVLEDEFVQLHGAHEFDHAKDAKEESRLVAIFDAIHALPSKRSALCLSGGGIRSATFCFGVLQGLAKRNLLDKFDYLSTVSGGGYIGSWLTAWIHRAGTTHVHNELKSLPKKKLEPEPKEISHLRVYSNYLSPKLGLLSADTWTLAIIYIRNLFLNWLVLLPLLVAVLLIPRMYLALIKRNFGINVGDFIKNVHGKHVTNVVLIIGLLFGAVALAYIGSHRPSLRRSRKSKDRVPDDLSHFLRWCMFPLISAVVLLTVGRAWYLVTSPDENWVLWMVAAGGAGLHGLGWLFTFGFVFACFELDVFLNFARRLSSRGLELLVILITGLLGGGLLWLLSIPEKIHRYNPTDRPEIFACLDGPRLMLVLLFMGILSIGLGSRYIDDEDREWWARAGAWVLIVIVIWAVVNTLVLYGPPLLPHLFPTELPLGGSLISLGIISGFVSILFGISSKTPANDRHAEKVGRLTVILNYSVKMAAPLFALFLVVVLSYFTNMLIYLIKYMPEIFRRERDWRIFAELDHYNVISNSSLLFLFCLFVGLLAISLLMALCINVNQFSLHSMYRNRLVRAYLGASNQQDRSATSNPFTGFDPNDNVTMSDLWPGKGKGQHPDTGRPLHIVNMTWNLVHGKNLAWQHRKATTFTVSPLHCGNFIHGYRSSKEYGGDPDPISLGTALAISGAAASPNMGYYSSSAVTFLMTLFNVRLGWWLGNPKKTSYRVSGPRVALGPMIDEAFGQTEDDKKYIYLSDGGHFDNLGLYEMVIRRCHYIVVVDATSDPDYKFENLGNALRRIRVDLGVDIEIRDIVDLPRAPQGAYCAIGDILYSKLKEGGDGVLIYIKPALRGGEPKDIFNYAQANVEFPHESTGDQFFSEQQFESYRALGLHAIEQIFKKDWTEEKGFRDLKHHVEAYIKDSKKIQ